MNELRPTATAPGDVAPTLSSPTFSRLESLFERAAALEGDELEAFLVRESERWPELVAKVRDLLLADAMLADRKTVRPVEPFRARPAAGPPDQDRPLRDPRDPGARRHGIRVPGRTGRR